MNNMKQKIHSKFSNLGKLRLDKASDSSSLALPPYADVLYLASKNDKDVYYEMYKKMSSICVQNYAASEDKKTKKNSWESMSGLLFESEKKLSDSSLIKEVMLNSIKVFDEMGHNTREFEKTLSLNVIKHFQELSEDNTLSNTKKTLTSLSKDMKANSEKVQALHDQLNVPQNDSSFYRRSVDITNLASAESKLASAQMLEESTEKEWENKKDFYLTKLFNAEAEKLNTAEKILEFLQGHLDYYAECQRILARSIPEIKASLDKNRYIFAFHVPLEEHLSATNRKLSYVLETCIQELDNEETLQHEGLFRISGSKAKVDLLKSALNVMRVDESVSKSFDSSVYAGVLKQYLRELPNPIMLYNLYDKWCEVGARIRQGNVEDALSIIKECLSQMPTCYYENLTYLMQFLRKIPMYESVNKMSASNLGLMLGPNMIRNKKISDTEDSEATAIMMLGSPGGSVLEFMISHFNVLFPDCPPFHPAPKVTHNISDVSSTVSLREKDIDKSIKSVKLSDMDVSGIIYEKDEEKCVTTSKQCNDTDSMSSGDLLLDDNISEVTPESNETLKTEINAAPSREMSVKIKPAQKPKAPPPPPQNKPYLGENLEEAPKETIVIRSEARPTVKKRTSRLERPREEPEDRISSESNQISSLPKNKINIIVEGSETIEKPFRPENLPLARPSKQPPPIPSFDKLKESLDQKVSSKANENLIKQSSHDGILSDSIGSELTVKKSHKYSKSDVTQTSF